MSNRTCEDRQVPRQTTGNTPLRNMRLADDVWLPALARAEAEDTTITAVVEARLREYAAEPLAPPRRFTFANWPEAAQWLDDGRREAFENLDAELTKVTGETDPEYVAVATWLAATRHPGDPSQQQRVLTGFLLGRALEITAGGWRDRYRDTRHLSEAIRGVLSQRLPLAAG